MRTVIALTICLVSSAAIAQNTMTQDAVKAARQPAPEINKLKAAETYASGYAPYSQAAMQADVNKWRIDGYRCSGRLDQASLCSAIK